MEAWHPAAARQCLTAWSQPCSELPAGPGPLARLGDWESEKPCWIRLLWTELCKNHWSPWAGLIVLLRRILFSQEMSLCLTSVWAWNLGAASKEHFDLEFHSDLWHWGCWRHHPSCPGQNLTLRAGLLIGREAARTRLRTAMKSLPRTPWWRLHLYFPLNC